MEVGDFSISQITVELLPLRRIGLKGSSNRIQGKETEGFDSIGFAVSIKVVDESSLGANANVLTGIDRKLNRSISPLMFGVDIRPAKN